MPARWHIGAAFRSASVAVLLLCLACDASVDTARHDTGLPRDGQVQRDGAPPDGAPTDGGPSEDAPSGIRCGAATCTDVEVCCTPDFGRTGTCEAFPPGCSSVTEARFICDGPEDCVRSAECCFSGNSSACLPDGSCDRGSGQVLCHDGADCADMPCCPAAAGSPYAMCFSSCPL